MANERLGIFEELQRRRARFSKRAVATRERCTKLGPAPNGAYAEPVNPFTYRLSQLGKGYHATNSPLRRHKRPVHPEAELGVGVCRVVQEVALAAGLPHEEFYTRSHAKRVLGPRQVAMWCIDRYCPTYSLPQIGYLFRRDHTTAMAAIKVVQNRLQKQDPATVELIAQVRQRLAL